MIGAPFAILPIESFNGPAARVMPESQDGTAHLIGTPGGTGFPERIMSALPKTLDQVLLERIQERTGRRVRDLSVEMSGELVVVRGRARSFHVKQLVLHGVRDVLPTTPLRNSIVVEAAA